MIDCLLFRSDMFGRKPQTVLLRRHVQLLIWMCLVILASAGVVEGAEVEQLRFDVQAGTADVVLKAIAAQSDRQILFPLEQLKSVKANGVHGEHSLREALDTALRGTPITAHILPSGAIAVSFASDQNATGGEAAMKLGKRGGIIGFLAALAAPVGALGQSGPTPTVPEANAASSDVQTVVVTGTLIKRNAENSQLVTNIDAEEIALRGATSATDILAAVSQMQLASTPNDGARTGSLTTLANLRALGPENTLVLVNGRRLVNNPIFDNGVDLNTIPTALIESVDVLSDGASSIYGSDAVAGVINFRLRSDFQGVRVNAQAFDPEHPGGQLYFGSLAAGTGSLKEDGWNFVVGGSWRERTEILSVNRDCCDNSYLPQRGLDNNLPAPFPANFYQPSTNLSGNPYYPTCTPPGSIPDGGGCRYNADAAGVIALQNPEKQRSGYARIATLISDQTLSLEYLVTQSNISNALAGTTLFGYTMPPINPYFPGKGLVPGVPGLDPTQPISIDSFYTPGGRRTTENQSLTDRLLLDFTGKVAGFDYDFFALRSTSSAELSALNGALLISGINNGLTGTNGAPFLNPFGNPTTAQEAYLQSIEYRGPEADGKSTLENAGVSVSRDFFQLPGGKLSDALALEWGRETFAYTNYGINNYLEGSVPGFATPASGSRDRYSVTDELLAPVLPRVSLDASVRYDHYSDFGHTTNPKVLVGFDATRTLNLHASYNKGFRAPPLPTLYAPQSISFISGLNNDPVLCPNGVVNKAAGGVAARDCEADFNSLSGGNLDLQPQRSTAYTAGFTLNIPGDAWALGQASLSVEWWHYDLTDTIGTLSGGTIFGNLSQFGNEIVRCSQANPVLRAQSFGCTFGGPGDPIAYVNQIEENLGSIETGGVDIGINWSRTTRYGTFDFNYRGTYIATYQFQLVPGGPTYSRKGVYLDGFPVIPYSHFAQLSWTKGPWQVAAQNQLRGGYEDCNAECGIAPQYFNHVGIYSLWNLVGLYHFSEDWTVGLHINNVFDTNPPFTSQTDGNCTGCDLRYVDPTGRSFGISIAGKLGH